MLGLGHRHNIRLIRHHDPGHDVAHDAEDDPGKERDDYPQHAHQRHVEVKVLRQPGTDASNLSVDAGTHKALAGAHRSHALAAIGTQVSVVLDHFAAVVAIHGSASNGITIPI